MQVLITGLGILSYTAAAIVLIADFFLYGIHLLLKHSADKFVSDGDALTGVRS